MNNLSQYDGQSLEDVVRANSHELTALHLLQARQHIVEQFQWHREQMDFMKRTLDEATDIGLRILDAKRKGRKTVRIDEVTS